MKVTGLYVLIGLFALTIQLSNVDARRKHRTTTVAPTTGSSAAGSPVTGSSGAGSSGPGSSGPGSSALGSSGPGSSASGSGAGTARAKRAADTPDEQATVAASKKPELQESGGAVIGIEHIPRVRRELS